MANNAIVTAQAGLSFCNKIIDSVIGPDVNITDALTSDQEDQLESLNKTRIYMTFGHQQVWDLYETDQYTLTNARANISVGNTIVTLTANANSEINVGDTLYFKNQGQPSFYTGGGSIINISAGGLVLVMNAAPDVSINNATVIRTTNGFTDNIPPPAGAATFYSNQHVWDNMIGGKIVTGNDLAVVATKWEWTANTVYAKYDPLDYSLFDKPFYVLTSNYSVYKCLDNYNDSESTVEPSYIPSNNWRTAEATSDGYVWKYMFTLSNSDIQKFLSLGYMPVRFLDSASNQPINQWNVQESAVDGEIENILVIKSGSGYLLPSDGPLTIEIAGGGGLGATALPDEIEQGTGRLITAYVTNPGLGYGTNVSRTFTSTVNTAILTHTGSSISNNYVNSAIFGTNIPTDAYVTYFDNSSDPKKVYISANATANGVVAGGIISGIPRVLITGGGGTGAEGYVTLTSNTVANVFLSNTGLGYVPPIYITATGDGEGATFSIDSDQVGLNGEILGVNVVNSGDGYSNVDISITGGFGDGAILRAAPGPQGGHGSNPQEELGARSLMVAVSITGSESGNLIMTLGNDFRQVALVENPIDSNTGNVVLSTAFYQARQIFVTPGITNYAIDEIIYQGDNPANASFSAVVQAFDSANNVVFVNNSYFAENAVEPNINLPLIGATSGAYRQYVSHVDPAAVKYSGRVLFIQNFIPVERSADQTEYVKVVINQ